MMTERQKGCPGSGHDQQRWQGVQRGLSVSRRRAEADIGGGQCQGDDAPVPGPAQSFRPCCGWCFWVRRRRRQKGGAARHDGRNPQAADWIPYACAMARWTTNVDGKVEIPPQDSMAWLRACSVDQHQKRACRGQDASRSGAVRIRLEDCGGCAARRALARWR
jgi:hypothetical protein